MKIRIEQDSEYQGDELWKWSVWLAGPPEDMDRIQSVTYVLHPTFHNPVRTITTRENGFRLDSSGWGNFLIRVKVKKADGEVIEMQQPLQLRYPDGRVTIA